MGASLPLLMPKLGLTMTEGVLAEWKVAPGDAVRPGDVLFIVETDKISTEIEAAEAGVIEALHAKDGDLLNVGDVVGSWITEAAPPAEPAVSPAPVAEPTGRIIATPLARRIAVEAGLRIETVSGSGPRGRIMADDVTAALQAKPAPPEARPEASPEAPPETMASAHGERLPLGQFQKVTARRLTEAKRDIPHFYVFAEADVTELLAARISLNADASMGKLTVNHFIITAVARALTTMPEVNRVWADDALLALNRVDVGMAVEGPKGLVAPVLRDLGDCGVDDVAQAATALVDKARAGRLSPDALQGGATSVSNVGMFGVTGLVPIINPGQSTILGVGRNQPVFRPDEQGRPVLRQVLSLTLSCDHRVIDGALAARFLQTIQHGLEAPLSLLRRRLQGQSA